MNLLPASFTGTRDQSGFVFTQTNRVGNIAIYRKFKPETKKLPRSPDSYEVVYIQQCPLKTWNDGRTTPAHEKFPRPEDWGMLGWSYSKHQEAIKKFESLVTSQRQAKMQG